MHDNGFFGHLSPTTGGPGDRVRRAGLSYSRIAENVGHAGTIEELQALLMRSPGHRSALLDATATHVGIGVVVSFPPGGGTASLIATQLYR